MLKLRFDRYITFTLILQLYNFWFLVMLFQSIFACFFFFCYSFFIHNQNITLKGCEIYTYSTCLHFNFSWETADRCTIVHFTVTERNKAGIDLVLIQPFCFLM